MKRVKNYYGIQNCINCEATLELFEVEKEMVKCSDSGVKEITEVLHCSKCKSYFLVNQHLVKRQENLPSLHLPVRLLREGETIKIVGLTQTATLDTNYRGLEGKFVVCTEEVIDEPVRRKIALILNVNEFHNFIRAISPSFIEKEDIEFSIVTFSLVNIFDIRKPIYITYSKTYGLQNIHYLFSNVKVR